jgi:hypothetical protein
MAKMSFGKGQVATPANTDAEWNAIARAYDTPFIRHIEEWDEFVNGELLQESPFGRLSPSDLAVFRSHLLFDESRRNGQPYRRCCSGWYYGDLIKDHKFTKTELADVAALFGVGPQRLSHIEDKFGDICDDEVCCRPRTAYACPDANDCTC